MAFFVSILSVGSIAAVQGAQAATDDGAALYVSPAGNDSGSGGSNPCTSKASPCQTISHAVDVASADDVIHLAAGHYPDPGGLLISVPVSIVGAGAQSSFIRGSNSGAPGSALLVQYDASLALARVTIEDSRTANSGGAIDNAGTLTLAGVRFLNDSSTDQGGAIFNDANGVITSMRNSAFISDTAVQDGGAIENRGTIGDTDGNYFEASDSRFFSGGAIDNRGDIQSLDEAMFQGNVAAGSGGAISNEGSIEHVDEVTFAGNISQGGDGGAISNVQASLDELDNDTFANNQASGVGAEGGAVYSNFGSVSTIQDDTFVGNDAATGGGVSLENSFVNNFAGTILDGNSASQDANCHYAAAFEGNLTDAGHNLLGDVSDTCGFSSTSHDLIGVAADLRPLYRYGHKLLTAPPAAGSPAIDGGGLTCPTVEDENGVPRPQGRACDIGAVEVIQ